MQDDSTHTEMMEVFARLSKNGKEPLPVCGHSVNIPRDNPLRIAIGPNDRESGIITVLGILHSTALNGGTAIVAQSGIWHLPISRSAVVKAVNVFLRHRNDKSDVMNLCGQKGWELPQLLTP